MTALKPKNILISLLLLAASVYVFYHWFFPISPYQYGDDWFVLPERLWFKDEPLAWLRHLLFYNQTRFTYVGDYVLYRPGVFTWIWLQDIFFRANRVGLQWMMIVATCGVLASLFLFVQRQTGKVLAVAACLYALASPSTNLLFAWPHISGYIFALGLYTLAAKFWLEDRYGWKRGLGVGALFFLAENFHEFVSITLVMLIAWDFLFWRRRYRVGSNWRITVLGLATALYLGMVATVRAITHPPSFFSPEDLDKLAMDRSYFDLFLERQGQIFANIFKQTIPFPLEDSGWEIARWIVGGLALLSLLWMARRRLQGSSRQLTVVLLPVLALLAGLAFSRVAMRGGIGNYYHEMFRYYLVMALVLVCAAVIPRRSWAHCVLIGILMASAMRTAAHTGVNNAAAEASNKMVIKTVREAREFLDAHSDRCFGGMFTENFTANFNQMVNLSLATYNCGWRDGRPYYTTPVADGPNPELNLNLEATPNGINLLPSLGKENATHEIEAYFAKYPYNFREAEEALVHDGLIYTRWTKAALHVHQVRGRFISHDEFPQLNNVGLAVWGAYKTHYVLVQDNNLIVLRRLGAGALQLVGQTQLNAIKPLYSIRIVDLHDSCAVFVDDSLMLQFERCFELPVQVGVFHFKNATPAEDLVELSGQ